MSQAIFFKIYKDGKLKGVKQVRQDQASIGQSSEVEISLDGKNVLPWHALVEKRGDEYFISDLGSANGTFVNEKKIVESPLQTGDRIQIDNFLIEFFIGVPYVKSAQTSPSAEPAVQDVEEPQAVESDEEPVKKTAKKPKKKKPVKKKAVSAKKETVEKKKVSEKQKTPEKKKKKVSEEKVSAAVDKKDVEQAIPPEDLMKRSFRSNPWKNFIPKKPATQTFAPPSEIKDLDRAIPPGRGGVVEVLVAWEERIISVYHSKKNEMVTIGNHPSAVIKIPNLFSNQPYSLVHAGQIAQVYIGKGMGGKIIRENKQVDFDLALKKGVMTASATGASRLSLGQKEVLRVDLHPSLRVYIRYTSLSTKAPKALLFDFNEAELVGIGLALCFMLALFFFVGIYYPRFLVEEEKLDEKVIRMATIQFKPPRRPKLARMAVQKQQRSKKENIPVRAPKKSKKPVQIKKAGKKPGKIGAVASKKVQKKRPKKVVTSARQGASPIKSKKGGSGARSPKPDPTKVGLLGVFGKGGIQKQLDKAYSGAGELGGLADQATGSSGTKETYSGEGYGTKFKDAGVGGKGSNLIGISGVSTRGRGGGLKGFGRGGGLGTRGSVNLSFGTSEIDVEGSVDRDAILRVVRSNRAQLERCHSMVLQNNPSIQGRIKVKWVIQNDRVVSARVMSNQSGSKSLAQCLVSRLKNWRFPGAVPRGASGEISFPFVFTGG
ncbi:MAG: AgmX/PglI C-terminal domain-containing protein [Bdellovibrionales bacterium]|nr:AgmX/PglI C-terminal domain-containing protein [Bdellovibrionales bacterium]